MILLRVALDESAEKRVSKDGEKSTGQTDAGVIERIIGTPHLYRINESDGASQQQQAIEQESVSRITSTICIIAIPHQTPFEELLDICGDPWSMVRRAIQIIDPQSPNIYTAVLDCLNEEAAETMFLLTNGRQMQFYDSSEVFVGLKAIYLDEWSESNPDSEDTSQQSHPTAETGVIEGKAHDLGDIYKSGSSKKKRRRSASRRGASHVSDLLGSNGCTGYWRRRPCSSINGVQGWRNSPSLARKQLSSVPNNTFKTISGAPLSTMWKRV